MKRPLAALGFVAPFALLACVTSNDAGPPSSADAGSPLCSPVNGVLVCGPADAAAYGCGFSATGAVTCPDATTDANALPDSAPPDAAPGDAAIDSAFPTTDAGSPPSATGTLVWASDIASNGSSYGKTVSDPQGNLYFAGTVTGTAAVAPGFSATNAFSAKVDATGAYQWVVSTGANEGYSIARDPVTGTLYAALGIIGQVTVGGTVYTSVGGATAGGLDFLIAKLDANGNVVDAKQFGGTGFDQPWDLSFGGGRLAVAGYTGGSIDFGGGTLTPPAGANAAFVLGLDASLSYVYAKEYGGAADAGGFGGQGYTVRVDANGNAYTGGAISGATDLGNGAVSTSGASAGFLVSLDLSGAYRWSHVLGTSSGACGGVAVAADGTVYAVGNFTGSADFGHGSVAASGSSGFVASWTNAGAYRWETTFSSDTNVYPVGVAVDLWDDAVITGWFSNDVTLGATKYDATSEENGFLAKVDATGSFLWSQQWSGAIDVTPVAVSVDDLGRIAATGGFFGGDMKVSGTTSLSGGASVDYGYLLMTTP